MLAEAGKTEIPFEFIGNHVVIPVAVNGRTLNLILDTGMPLDGALLFGNEKVHSLGLQYVGKAPVRGIGGTVVESDLAMGVTLSVPEVEFTNQMVLVMPQDSARALHFEGKDGVIGNTLFSRFAVGIDHDMMKVSLTEPDIFAYEGCGREIPARIDRYPFIVCDAAVAGDRTVPVELLIDTGNAAAFTLNAGSQEGLILPEKTIEYHARSVGQEILRLAGRIEHLRIGPYKFERPLGSFRTADHEPPPPWSKAGALGQEILRRFNAVIDYPNERIILEPNHHYDEPFDFNMAGIQFARGADGAFVVTRVIAQSPAGEAGLDVGDRIARINGREAGDFSIDDAADLLKRQGEEVTLDVLRGDQPIEVRLKLRRLI
jgi:hypothetical protein